MELEKLYGWLPLKKSGTNEQLIVLVVVNDPNGGSAGFVTG
jgi:hypothetical protein